MVNFLYVAEYGCQSVVWKHFWSFPCLFQITLPKATNSVSILILLTIYWKKSSQNLATVSLTSTISFRCFTYSLSALMISMTTFVRACSLLSRLTEYLLRTAAESILPSLTFCAKSSAVTCWFALSWNIEIVKWLHFFYFANCRTIATENYTT